LVKSQALQQILCNGPLYLALHSKFEAVVLLFLSFIIMEIFKGWVSLRGLLLIFLLSSTSIILFLQIGALESRPPGSVAPKGETNKTSESWCPLPTHPSEVEDGLQPSGDFEKDAFVKRQVERLSAAVNIPTVSYEDNGDVGRDKRWEVFGEFHKVLEHLFPLV
jgi:hypothetical protein